MTGDPRRSHLDDPAGTLGERNLSASHVGPIPGPLAQASDRARSRLEAAIEGTTDKATAGYQPATTSERCGRCINFTGRPGEPEGTCSIVAGRINQGDTCEYFSRRREERHPVANIAQLSEPARADEEATGREAASATDVDSAGKGVK